MRPRALPLLLGAALLLGGCTGGPEPTADPDGSAAPSPRWRPGEFKERVQGLCRQLPVPVRERLGVAPSRTYGSGGRSCVMTEPRDRDIDVEVKITQHLYTPPATRLEVSASREAAYHLRRPPGWEGLPNGTAVRGLGDQARIVREWSPAFGRNRIHLTMRVRNVLVQLEATHQALASEHRDQIAGLGELESAGVAALRETLSRFDVRPGTPRGTPPAGTDMAEAGDVCDAAAQDARRLVPGGRPTGTTPEDGGRTGGCHWEAGGADSTSLTVNVLAVPSSAATGETGTRVATVLLHQWEGDGTEGPDLGDAAKRDHTSFDGGRARGGLLVRHRNLLVHVSHSRGGDPSRKALDAAVDGVAASVLKGLS